MFFHAYNILSHDISLWEWDSYFILLSFVLVSNDYVSHAILSLYESIGGVMVVKNSCLCKYVFGGLS